MERTPKRFEFLEFERERLEIDAPCVVRLFKHGRRVRIEVAGYLKEPVLKKTLDPPIGEGDTSGTT